MGRRLLGYFVCGTLAGVTVGATAPIEQKPVVSIPFRVEGRGAVATLDELWNNSDIVGEGMIDAETPHQRQVGNPSITITYTKYSVRLLEVFRRSAAVPAAPSLIPVRRRGGLRELGDRTESHVPNGYPLWQVGERYILFLRQQEWSDATPDPGIYYNETTYGPDSAFQVVGAKVITSGQARLSRALGVLSADALRAELRGRGRKR